MMTTANRSEVLRLAHQIRRATPSLTWGECQRQAWKGYRLRTALRAGKAQFTFTKENGEAREAVGTLNSDLFQYIAKTTTEANANPLLVKYYDLGANGWRCCRVERIVSIAA